jgi:lipoprotein signal peptidase
MGLGDLRWYTFNVADAAISCSILLLLLGALLPGRFGMERTSSSRGPGKPAEPLDA